MAVSFKSASTGADKLGMADMSSADFKLFIALWNQEQNLTTPDLHFRIADWLEYSWVKGDVNLLLMVFRSAGKSTLTGLFCAWLLYIKRDLRILVLAADQALAGKMVRNVKRIIERHPLCEDMRPDNPDQWASERFTVNRPMELRDPSMLARGISANLTGSRADIVICDDVEVPNTCGTAEKREELRERLGEISYVLVPGGTQLYIGTPHHYYSIYAKRARKDVGEVAPFLKGFKRLEIPALNKDGKSAWPARFTEHGLKQMRLASGPAKFDSQMMLKPTNIAQGRLNPDLLQFYSGKLAYNKALKQLFIGDERMISAAAHWDPAFGSATGDKSVLAIVYSDAKGRRYVHNVTYIDVAQCSDIHADEATQQCKIVANLAAAHYLPFVSVETNGLGRFLPGLLRNELVKANVPCAVKEITSRTNKAERILEAFDAPLAARRLYVSDEVCAGAFVNEMREWLPLRSSGHDDGLDAVAGALAQDPLRSQRLYPAQAGGQLWMSSAAGRGGVGSYQAQVNFNV